MSLVHRKGYFRQQLDAQGQQTGLDVQWSPADMLVALPTRVTVNLAGRDVVVRACPATSSRSASRAAPPRTKRCAATVGALSLYDRLETVILPLYYRNQDRYIDLMKHAIALNGSHFNTERMVDQYVRKAYFR